MFFVVGERGGLRLSKLITFVRFKKKYFVLTYRMTTWRL